MLREIDIPPLWLALFAAVAWSVGALVPIAVPFGGQVGGVLIGLGLMLMVLAVVQMLLRHTSFIPRRDPTDLVTSGAFAVSRNPIYLGDALVLTGLCLWWDAVLALVLVPVFMAFITQRYIRGEEARIAEHFGAKYETYRARTRRWL